MELFSKCIMNKLSIISIIKKKEASIDEYCRLPEVFSLFVLLAAIILWHWSAPYYIEVSGLIFPVENMVSRFCRHLNFRSRISLCYGTNHFSDTFQNFPIYEKSVKSVDKLFSGPNSVKNELTTHFSSSPFSVSYINNFTLSPKLTEGIGNRVPWDGS